MVYRKKYMKKRKTKKGKKSLSKKLSKLSKFVYKTIEKKQVDFANIFLTFNNLAWRSQQLCKFDPIHISPGVPINPNGPHNAQRIGNSITLGPSIACALYIESLDTNDNIRIIAVQWASKNSIVQPLTDPELFLEDAGSNFQCLTSPYKIGSTEKYKILYDKLINPKYAKTTLLHKFKVRGYNNLITYSPNSLPQVAAAPVQNSIVLYLFCSNSSAAVAPIATLGHRMTFRDA